MAERRWVPEPWQADLVAVVHDAPALLELPPARLDLTVRLLRRSQLLGRVAHRLQVAGLLESATPVVRDQLTSALVVAGSRVRAARWELDRITLALDGMNDVPIVALKGCAYLLAGTQNAAGRIFADVDLMAPEARLGEVEARLKSRGWQMSEVDDYDDRYYRELAHELPPMAHPDRGIELDLHHNILMRTARLKPSAELLFADARSVPGTRFKVLSPVDMVLHSIVHLFYGGEMDDVLRDLVDIDRLMRHFAATEPGFWGQFWPRTTALDLARPAFYGLRFAQELLGTPVPDSVIEASSAGAPSAAVLLLMDRLVPRALFPQHPDGQSRVTEAARLMLYVRSHWVKMPPLPLARHLLYKFFVR